MLSDERIVKLRELAEAIPDSPIRIAPGELLDLLVSAEALNEVRRFVDELPANNTSGLTVYGNVRQRVAMRLRAILGPQKGE